MPDFILTPKTPADYSNNVLAARVLVAGQLGLSMSTGSAAEFGALTPADQIRLSDAMAAFIVSQPAFFSEVAVATSQKRVASPLFNQPLADTSLAASAGQFVTELAGSVESKFTRLAVVGIIAALAFAILPGALARAGVLKLSK